MRYLAPSLGCSLGCLILSSTCLAQTWTQVKTTTSPSARWQQAMSYDFVIPRQAIPIL